LKTKFVFVQVMDRKHYSGDMCLPKKYYCLSLKCDILGALYNDVRFFYRFLYL